MTNTKQLNELAFNAILHVCKYCPTVDRVTIWGDGRWQFSDADHNTPTFPDNIDIAPLEDLADAVNITPFSFQLPEE